MKTKHFLIFLVFIVSAGFFAPFQKVSAQGGSVSFQVFYDELSPYGTWVTTPDYGYVWVPNVDPGFTPYATNGYWVFTDMGWTWVSNYQWGWAPFHYGRWYTDPYYGAMWVPGNEWGPGWVTWRRSGGYYGWAPIGPGVSISMAYSNSYVVPHNQWTFVSDGYLGRTNIYNYYVSTTNNAVIIRNSTVITNTRVDNSRHVTYNAGPDRVEVERHVGKPITPVAIRESSKPGHSVSNNQLQLYRPNVQKAVASGPKPAPVKVATYKGSKTPAQKTTGTSIKQTAQPTKQQPAQQQQQPKSQPAKQQPAQQQQQQKSQPAKQQPVKQQGNQSDKSEKEKQSQQGPPKKLNSMFN